MNAQSWATLAEIAYIGFAVLSFILFMKYRKGDIMDDTVSLLMATIWPMTWVLLILVSIYPAWRKPRNWQCKRCARLADDCRANGCERGPCPMEPIY